MSVSPSVPVSGVALEYQNFFHGIQWMTAREQPAALHLSEGEIESLKALTAGLARASEAMDRNYRKWQFESLMEKIEIGETSPAVKKILGNLEEWSRTIRDFAERMKAALGEARFQEVDAFVRSDQAKFDTTWRQTPVAKTVIK